MSELISQHNFIIYYGNLIGGICKGTKLAQKGLKGMLPTRQPCLVSTHDTNLTCDLSNETSKCEIIYFVCENHSLTFDKYILSESNDFF